MTESRSYWNITVPKSCLSYSDPMKRSKKPFSYFVINPCYITPCFITPCFINQCFITPCFIKPCFITPCFIKPCFIPPCFIKPCFINPVHVLPIKSSPYFITCAIRQHDNRSLLQRTAEGSVFSSHNTNNALDRSPPTMSEVCDTPITNNHGGTNSPTQ